ncbi:hypothetical protein [uncultured Porphyromonas sp.]|uniref:hypothetical protein n=1 Tax=uncultured Porphyromonas sp. TaxID=159274 RepID=UPI002629BAF8|nr:hypothetical protein [uncultured Porphyromonas sp.]
MQVKAMFFQVSGARYLLLSKLHLRVASHLLGTPGVEFFGVSDQHNGGDGIHSLAGDEMLVVAVYPLIFLDNLKHSALTLLDAFGQEVNALLGVSIDKVIGFRLARNMPFFLGYS